MYIWMFIQRRINPRHAMFLMAQPKRKLPWQVTGSQKGRAGRERLNANKTCQQTALERQGDLGGEPTGERP